MNRLRACRAIALSVCLLTIAGLAQAVRLERPYSVDVPVASQSVEDRNKAAVEALLRLTMRLSGQAQARDNAQVKAAAAKIDSYILQFSYQPGPDNSKLLRVQFVAAAVDQLLQSASLPLWPLDRPAVLVVLARDDGGTPQLWLQPEAWTALVSAGSQRGVPVIAPVEVASALQQAHVDGKSVMALTATGLDELAHAAGADAVLLGSLHDGGADGDARWQGKWLLHRGERDQRFELHAADPVAMTDAAFVRTADSLAQQYRGAAATDTAAVITHLEVAGVTNYSDYTQLRSYLEKLDIVTAVKVSQIHGSTVKLDVTARGRDNLQKLLGLARFLRAVDVPAAVAPAPAAPVATPAAVPTPAPAAPSTTAPSTTAPSTIAPADHAAPVAAPPSDPLWKYQWVS